jgi:hypothetical protein
MRLVPELSESRGHRTRCCRLPVPDPVMGGHRQRIILSSEMPSAMIMAGCRFHPRCWCTRLGNPMECTTVDPQPQSVTSEHEVACHFSDWFGALPPTAGVALAGKPTLE